LDCTVVKNFQFAQIIREKPLLTSLIVNILLKISVFQWLSMVTGNCELCKLVCKAWNAIYELYLEYWYILTIWITKLFIPWMFVTRPLLHVPVFTILQQFPMIMLFYNPKFSLQKSNLSPRHCYTLLWLTWSSTLKHLCNLHTLLCRSNRKTQEKN